MNQFLLNKSSDSIIAEAEQRIWSMVQLHVKNIISSYDSEDLNDKRSELRSLRKEELNVRLIEDGIEIEDMEVRDLTFPKLIQDLFSKQLEAKIRAKTDLENARIAIATARTLKNTAELIKGNEDIRFFQLRRLSQK